MTTADLRNLILTRLKQARWSTKTDLGAYVRRKSKASSDEITACLNQLLKEKEIISYKDDAKTKPVTKFAIASKITIDGLDNYLDNRKIETIEPSIATKFFQVLGSMKPGDRVNIREHFPDMPKTEITWRTQKVGKDTKFQFKTKQSNIDNAIYIRRVS